MIFPDWRQEVFLFYEAGKSAALVMIYPHKRKRITLLMPDPAEISVASGAGSHLVRSGLYKRLFNNPGMIHIFLFHILLLI